ncbi:2-oxo-4-hydroxy-4-carboxy-5-ureidoimidazoline decarboxylase [Paenibacillus rigui]|uniref:2-oxo-4-hydroxy-4-carboxy-5-ureidoimidazoline decarboxylase n=1 Tax=Paenibacillus rigui TaxID=554312 RepID=A0A229UVA5_9BACL|nr:2-oxo-4-hydroxy-4-carboxy-5-ureidoimidazoline decarboxylase [Paenibacillus rigui]OXM87334.1 OHCU decarboxylase [Paenibacillus rigui]
MEITLGHVNRMTSEAFIESLGWIFEHSPWVAKRAWTARPFSTLEQLHRAMVRVVEEAALSEQLELLRAHPDLAGRLQMTDASVKEQQGVGLDRLTAAEYEQFTAWNRAYTERFGFPFIMAVRGQTKDTIAAAMRQRVGNEPERELETALHEVSKIARFRLNDLIHQ